MRYSLELHYRRYVQGQGFMSFARNIGNKYGKKIFDKSLDVGKSMKNKYGRKILDHSLSAGKDFAKIAGKKVLTKSAEATGDLIGNKIDKINNLLLSEDNESEKLSKFVTREYVRVNSLSNTYNENKSIRFKTPMLKSNLCDYSDAYILAKGTITVTALGANNGANNIRDKKNRPLILKNNAPFVSCVTRINGELIEDADDLDIVMSMHNLLEYRKNYRKTKGSLYNYYRDELSDDADYNNFDNIKVVNSNTFKYKNKITGNTYDVDARIPNPDGAGQIDNPISNVNKNGTQEVELAIPLKYLGNFWRALNIPLISCEVSLELKWDKNCVITSLEQRDIGGGNRDNSPTSATLAINDCKLYVPAVTLSKDDEIKLLTNLKSGFKREIIWNKYRSQMTTEAIDNNLNILIDPTFTNVNRLFVLAYQTANDRQSFSQFYLPRVMVKDFNVFIDKLEFFDLPIKPEEEAYEKIIDISRNNEYTTGNLLDYDYFKKYYKLIGIDLSKQQVLKENEDLIQQINFIGKLEEAANVFIIIEKKENTLLEFSQNLANVIYK